MDFETAAASLATDEPQAEAAEETSGGLETSGGSWTSTTPVPVTEGAQRGAELTISFRPNGAVESSKIGLTQTTKATRKGGATDAKAVPEYGGDDIRKSRALTEGDEAGTNIDGAAGRATPYFAGRGDAWKKAEGEALKTALLEKVSEDVKKTGGAGTDPILGTTENNRITANDNATPGGSAFGSRQGDKVVDATLRDRAKLTWSKGETIDCTFETTAVSLDGPQKGVFYGSISWGYHVDAKGDVTVDPLAIVRLGTPTETFRKATAKWNGAPGYNLKRNFEKRGIKDGGGVSLLGDAGKADVDKWMREKGKTPEWGTVDVKVAGNEQLAMTDHESLGKMPTGKELTDRIAALTAKEADLTKKVAAAKEGPDRQLLETTLANVKFELGAMSRQQP